MSTFVQKAAHPKPGRTWIALFNLGRLFVFAAVLGVAGVHLDGWLRPAVWFIAAWTAAFGVMGVIGVTRIAVEAINDAREAETT